MHNAIPEKLNMIDYVCDQWVEKGYGNQAAIYSDNRVITFSELQKTVNKFGNAFLKIGICQGERVIVRMPTSLESIVAVLALIKIGAVPITLSILLGTSEIEHIIDNSEAVAYCSIDPYFLPEDLLRKKNVRHILHLKPECEGSLPDIASIMPSSLESTKMSKKAAAFILYSTGTTGLPKGILHGHQFIVGVGETMGRQWMQLIQGEDLVLHPHEISFSYTWSAGLFAPLYCGVPIVLFSERLSAENIVEKIKQYPITVFCSVPTVFRMLLSFPHRGDLQLSNLKRCISAGEPLPKEVAQRWENQFQVPIYDGIGTTESFLFCAQGNQHLVVYGSMGKPLPGYEVSIHNEHGEDCPPGVEGHLAIRDNNPSLFLEYVKLTEKWEDTHRDGWFYPGDYAYKDEDGYFYHVSRTDDIIKSRGYLISPTEVEEALISHSLVKEVGVIGVPDNIIGQLVKAFVVLKDGVNGSQELAMDIRECVRSRIALFKAPKEIEFVSELPRSLTGKLLRKNLRAAIGQENKNSMVFKL